MQQTMKHDNAPKKTQKQVIKCATIVEHFLAILPTLYSRNNKLKSCLYTTNR